MSENPTPATEPATTEILLELLKRAAAAHGVHEKNDLGGVYDQDWPEWYAAHMSKALDGLGYRLVRKTSGLM